MAKQMQQQAMYLKRDCIIVSNNILNLNIYGKSVASNELQ